MSIIQNIRDKAAWIIIGAIALALIAFIVQDAFQGRGGGWFSGNSTTLGKVNGTKIDAVEFDKKYKIAEDNYRNQYSMNDQMRQQLRESLWNEYVEEAILTPRFEELGLRISEKEDGDILYGSNPPQQLRQQFTDSTGQYNPTAAYQAIKSIKKNSLQYQSFWGEFVPALRRSRLREKYLTLVANTVYAPKWLVEKTNAENSQRSTISYVNVPYSTIPDSTIKVSDAEVKEYVNDHKGMYQQETSRAIEYVVFNAAPGAADSAAAREQLEKIKDSFATATDIKAFLQKEYSQTPYYESNISRKEIKIPVIDQIVAAPLGSVYGPYLDGSNYAMARVMDVKQWPDTVKVRHILIATQQQNQQGQTMQVREDSAAKKLVDSIALAIRTGSNFDSLCVQFSDDPGSKSKGGVYENIVTGRMVPAFNDFIFGKGTGEKGIVKTEYGYHYIEILSQKGSSPAYKIAYISKPIFASDETVNGAMGLASQFAAQNRSYKQFEENAKKQNLNKFNAADIKPNDDQIVGVGSSRELVRWIYNDAKVGQVADHAFLVQDKYVVPVLTQEYEKGPMSVDKARSLVEYKIRNKKKAEAILKKIGTPASLEAVSQAAGQPVLRADSVQFSNGYIPNVGQELKLIGAAFNKNNQGKVSAPIIGETGVFVIRVENISAVPNGNFDAKQQQLVQQQSLRYFNMGQPGASGIMEVLKKAADLKDNRVKYF